MSRNLSAMMLRQLMWFSFVAMPLSSHAIEEPNYAVVRKLDQVEVRQYAPHVVAEVVLNVNADEAGNRAFPILAGYIFGKNKGEKKFAMTAPVTQTAVPVKMDMTAPVTQSAVAGGTRVHRLQWRPAGAAFPDNARRRPARKPVARKRVTRTAR